jgi:hypothetical protein
MADFIIEQVEINQGSIDKIVGLYQNVWSAQDEQSFESRLLKHSTYEGFQMFTASGIDGAIAGFIYGYTSLPGQYYRNLLEEALSLEESEKWLVHCFELVELAVDPVYVRRGIATGLHNRLQAAYMKKRRS